MSDKFIVTMVAGNNQFQQMEEAIQDRDDIVLNKINYRQKAGDVIADAVIRSEKSDVVLFFLVGTELYASMEPKLKPMMKDNHFICVGKNPLVWGLTSVEHEIAVKAYSYLLNSGKENYRRLVQYLLSVFRGTGETVLPPVETPWEGIVHPDAPNRVFRDRASYLKWYHHDPLAPWVGMAVGRESWFAGGSQVSISLLRELESQGINVIMAMSKPKGDTSVGALGIGSVIHKFMTEAGKSAVDAMVLGSTQLGEIRSDEGERIMPSEDFFQFMDVPIFCPVVTSRMSIDEWEKSTGIGSDVSSHVILPEYKGFIEPVMIGSSFSRQDGSYDQTPIISRCRRVAQRILKRIQLRKKPNSAKKIVFFLNIGPCASLEANIGLASSLDTFGSVVKILERMKEDGYSVEVPGDGNALLDMILNRKAFSEFRWTPLNEIDESGGVLYRMDCQEYRTFFDTLPRKTVDEMVDTWGAPPGKGMVRDGNILITGIHLGNVIIAVQPKRGCNEAKCDGEACKMLHNPHCPPSHHYLATYHYLENIWGADAMVQVGSHGTLEHLPGKNIGLSDSCYPDIGIGEVPLMYIFNACDSSNGTIAKRRIYATLVDHMQGPSENCRLYDEFQHLEQLLSQYLSAELEPAHARELKKLILKAADEAHLIDAGISAEMSLRQCVKCCNEALFRIRNTKVQTGLHRFGDIPGGNDRCSIISSALRFETDKKSLRAIFSEMSGYELDLLYRDIGEIDDRSGKSHGDIISEIDNALDQYIALLLTGNSVDNALETLGLTPVREQLRACSAYSDEINELSGNIEKSFELTSFMRALEGRYTLPGPSGAVSRGCPEIFPTGRNFYSLNPHMLPTESAWNIGSVLADRLLEKYVLENGGYPENIAFAWLSSDMTVADGEIMAQMMSVMGVKPVRSAAGKVTAFDIIPQNEMSHPRIDITVRISGTISGFFINCVDLIDAAVVQLSKLDEPEDFNFIRKHTNESLRQGADEVEASSRIFGCAPGGNSGLYYAIASGAWKDDSDLAKIYLSGNGYSYGNGKNGASMHGQLAYNLSRISVTFNRIATDERDLLLSGAYFVSQGGMALASEYLTGNKVKSYFGDTREPENITVRTLGDEIRRISISKVLNPEWIEGMKNSGYKGASNILGSVQMIFGWQTTSRDVDGWIFDGMANKFVNDDEMRKFFKENNPYALEAIARRLLEAESRGLWDADEKTLDKLKEHYLEFEGVLEDLAGEGAYQGSDVTIISPLDDPSWVADAKDNLDAVKKRIRDAQLTPDRQKVNFISVKT